MRRIVAAALLTLTVACGPGREAAWEKTAEAPAAQPAASAAQAESLEQQAKALWDKRTDRAALTQAIAIWEQLAQQNPGNTEILTSLSRAYYLLGDAFMRLAGESEAMLVTFEKGMLAGERAMMASSPEFTAKVQAGEEVQDAVTLIPPAGQAAIYWYAANTGKFAAAKGFTTRLFYKDRLFALMQRVLAIDENYFYAAPHRYFGGFYAIAPSFAGGDLNKSKEHFEKALNIDSRYLGTKVLYAEFYATKANDKELFTRLLNEVKSADPAVVPEIMPENTLEQEKAERLLSQTGELFE